MTADPLTGTAVRSDDHGMESAMTERIIHTADLRTHASHPNGQDVDLLVQTESPNTVLIRDMAPRAYWRKSNARKASLVRYGEPRWVSGCGCRGGWSIDGVTPERLGRLAQELNATVVVYAYPGCPIPEHLAGWPAYEGDGTGWQRKPVTS